VTSTRTRLAAIQAFRSSVGIFLTTLLFIPFAAVINRVFKGTWYVDWRLILTVSGVLTVVFFTFFFVSQLMDDQAEEKRERQTGRAVFAGATWVRGVYLGVVLLGTVLPIGTYVQGEPTWVVIIPVAFIPLGIILWPPAIEVQNGEIRQRDRLFRLKTIPLWTNRVSQL
jgi:L-asparagine transporter-like permease